MKKTAIILFFQCCFISLQAQVNFKTIVPQQPIVVGESFQVQYVISGADKISSFKAPPFDPFRFVSGPDLYNGTLSGASGNQQLKNYVLTLEATRPGSFIIHGAAAIIDGKVVGSNQAIIKVISKEQAKNSYTDNSAYLLHPGEDPHEKIKQNLFLKLVVDKRNCYTGEPILATFKLYSGLQSKSDIIKNPGFYGFTVFDMINLDDKAVATETINGKTFDVHTIRMVQLFPLQPGQFAIDAMEVKNKVEFSRSIINRKTEQQITEGVLNTGDDKPAEDNTEVFETTIKTEPVIINVKPVPAVKKPADFNGAAGSFDISSSLARTRLAKNEEGFFDVVIRGQGNFTQINAPFIHWPEGIEGFESNISDSLDKSKFPLSGSRVYHYGFVCAKPGKYQLPQISFSFFDPSSDIYKTVSSAPIELIVGEEDKVSTVSVEKKVSIAQKNARASRIAGIIIISCLLAVLLYWIRYKKEPARTEEETQIVLPAIDEILASAKDLVSGDPKAFYASLHQCIWNYLTIHFGLSGSEMNKKSLLDKLTGRRVNIADISDIISLLEQCETGIFTNVAMQESNEAVFEKGRNMLRKINIQLF